MWRRCLDYLSSLDDAESRELVLKQALESKWMTDLLAATACLSSSSDDAVCARAHDDVDASEMMCVMVLSSV